LVATIEDLKEFLGKLHRRKLYEGPAQFPTKDKYYEFIEEKLRPQGADKFRVAYRK